MRLQLARMLRVLMRSLAQGEGLAPDAACAAAAADDENDGHEDGYGSDNDNDDDGNACHPHVEVFLPGHAWLYPLPGVYNSGPIAPPCAYLHLHAHAYSSDSLALPVPHAFTHRHLLLLLQAVSAHPARGRAVRSGSAARGHGFSWGLHSSGGCRPRPPAQRRARATSKGGSRGRGCAD